MVSVLLLLFLHNELPSRIEVHSVRHLVNIFEQENYEREMIKQKQIFTFYIQVEKPKIKDKDNGNTEGSEAQKSTLFSSLRPALTARLEYKTMLSTQSMSLCQHTLASQKPCLRTWISRKTERNETALLSQTLAMIPTEAGCQTERRLSFCATSKLGRSEVMQQTGKKKKKLKCKVTPPFITEENKRLVFVALYMDRFKCTDWRSPWCFMNS